MTEAQLPWEATFPRKLGMLWEPHRYKVLYGGRGGAKSWGIARSLLLQGAEKPLRIVCARETMQSMKDSVHKLLSDKVRELGLEEHYVIEKARIFKDWGNGAVTEFVFVGLRHNVHNIKSLEGADIVWVEEAENVSKVSWDTLIPTIRKPGSEIWVAFNPRLETDATYQQFIVSPPPGACVVNIGWRDNPWFPEDLRVHMEHLKLTDPQTYRQVYEGECRSSVEGAIFETEVALAETEGRITAVPYDRTRPVDTIWDLGFGDRTAIWFVQAYGGFINLIDYHEDKGKTLEHYLVVCQQKGYLHGIDWLPHDGVDAILHKKLTSNPDMSPEMLLRAAGRNVRLVVKLLVSSRINAARTVFSQCRFDREKCKRGLHALRMYQWGPLSDKGLEPRKPLHDEYSHGADAFTEVAVAIKQPRVEAPKPRPVAYRSNDYTPFA